MADTRKYTFVQYVVKYFYDRPGEWIDARDLMQVGGTFAWRTRISDARSQYGMRIENKTEHVHTKDGQRYTRSLYRYVPSPPVLDLLDRSS